MAQLKLLLHHTLTHTPTRTPHTYPHWQAHALITKQNNKKKRLRVEPKDFLRGFAQCADHAHFWVSREPAGGLQNTDGKRKAKKKEWITNFIL